MVGHAREVSLGLAPLIGMKVDTDFFDYMDRAFKHFKTYAKKEKEGPLTFDEFLLLIMTYKLEEVIRKLDEKN